MGYYNYVATVYGTGYRILKQPADNQLESQKY